MNRIIHELKTILRGFIAGTGFKTLWNELVKGWLWVWDQNINVWIGCLLRAIYKHFVKVDENKVFFNAQEDCYCCNPKYISEELHKEYPDVKIVWRAPKGVSSLFPTYATKEPFNSFGYFKELYSSKVVVVNSFFYMTHPVHLKKNQVLIQTWHGSLGLKKHSKETMRDLGARKRLRALTYVGKRTDYFLSNSTLENGSMRETYWPKTPMLEYGHARNDVFFNKERMDEMRTKLINRFSLKPDTRFVLYAPTFRDNPDFSTYDLDYQALVKALEERFGGKWGVLVRFHPSLRKVHKKAFNSSAVEDAYLSNGIFVYDMTNEQDMQEIAAAVDVAITDYSSWIYDFMLTRKPGFIFATDIKHYTEKERGFYYPIETVPFPIAESNEALFQKIREFDMDKYSADLEAFLDSKGCIEDGHAAERAVRLIKSILDNRGPVDAEEYEKIGKYMRIEK